MQEKTESYAIFLNYTIKIYTAYNTNAVRKSEAEDCAVTMTVYSLNRTYGIHNLHYS